MRCDSGLKHREQGSYTDTGVHQLRVPDNSKIQVVVLMGGVGSRLGSETEHIPKPMVEVNGRPFFEYELKLLLNAGFRRFLFLVGYLGDQIKDYFGDGSTYGSDVEMAYSYDGERRRGTGGAILNAMPLLDEDILLLYGDSFMDVDYNEIVYRYFKGKSEGKKALMTVLENNNRFDKSNILYENGQLLKYDKKGNTPNMRYIDYGIGMYQRSTFADFTDMESFDLAELQARIVDDGKCSTCEVAHRFYEIGTPASLEEFRQYTKKRFLRDNIACFLDRDGVINEIVYNDNTEQLDSPMSIAEIEFVPKVIEALRRLSTMEIKLFIVTNQPAAAKGKVGLEILYDINTYIVKELKNQGIEIEGVLLCPHHPKGSERTKESFLIKQCTCRKPETGMIDEVMMKYRIDKEFSYMVGDSFTDILCGRRAGLKTAFIGDYKCDVCGRLKYEKPDIIGAELMEVALEIGRRIGEQP